MKRKWILICMAVLAVGTTACSAGSKESVISEEKIFREERDQKEAAETKVIEAANDTETPQPESQESDETESVTDKDNPAIDVMCGIVEKYEDNIITIVDTDDDMRYYFFTDHAQILEGYSMEGARMAEEDLTIAVGDRVEIKYRGLVGIGEYPTEAVKIVVITVE